MYSGGAGAGAAIATGADAEPLGVGRGIGAGVHGWQSLHGGDFTAPVHPRRNAAIASDFMEERSYSTSLLASSASAPAFAFTVRPGNASRTNRSRSALASSVAPASGTANPTARQASGHAG